jgi:hypothetical protein
LVSGQRLLHCCIQSGIEPLVASELPLASSWWRRRLKLLLEVLLLLPILLCRLLLRLGLLCRRWLLCRWWLLLHKLLLWLGCWL